MGLFGFLKKDKVENENKSKPFHKNTNNFERKDWFSRTRPWHKVDPIIIDALIAKYNDDPMFEVFVITSMDNGLVKEYEDIELNGIGPKVACSVISGILFKHGANASAHVANMFRSGNINERKLSKVYGDAMNLLESARIIDANQINAYVLLASLKRMLNKKDEALSFAQQGLRAIKRIKESKVPFHESNIPEIQNAAQHLDATEEILLAFEREFS
ncbi:MAG: hypothetical protein Q7T21_10255 [Gallionella sp.]|nr:hypothetical protein [Gallionella sp.]